MPSRYGRYYRRRARSTRRYRKRPTYRRRFKRFRRYRRRSTASSVIKLSQDATWTLNSTGTPTHWNAFSFSPVSLPGFTDYQTTYTHFRILKAKLFVSRTIGDNDGSLYNYLVVGSRPFAATSSGTYPNNASLLPSQPEDALRQTKWQKIHYPNTTTQRVSAGFYPYTMIGTQGPAAVGSNTNWFRIWEAKKWMPFKWALDTGASGLDQYQALTFYGPYMVVDTNKGELTGEATVQCTLQIHVQFKGQK
ncbi:capsid protein [Sigmofec virus UA08Rod_21233]|uniref:Capsid protein n=1 Tax=Sigmofec virus UA08Rod_21233 TaxID=2929268 RepID=A0A976R547_9VIRU|nr:capsid protein [Sigmofec virus UA08Rod_21233]